MVENPPTLIPIPSSTFTSTFKHCFGLWGDTAVPTKRVGIKEDICCILKENTRNRKKTTISNFNWFWSLQESILIALVVIIRPIELAVNAFSQAAGK